MKLQSIPDSEIAEREEYAFRITQLIREGEITEPLAIQIMKVIDNPEYMPQLEKEVKMLKDLITKQLK